MKDPTLAIRTAYFSLITAALPSVKIYDTIVANDAPARRIMMGGQTYVEEGDKDNFGGLATIDIEIISTYPIGSGGGKWSDETATAVMQAVSNVKGTCNLSVTGWNIINAAVQIVPFSAASQSTSGDYLHRKILRFSHLVYQL